MVLQPPEYAVECFSCWPHPVHVKRHPIVAPRHFEDSDDASCLILWFNLRKYVNLVVKISEIIFSAEKNGTASTLGLKSTLKYSEEQDELYAIR